VRISTTTTEVRDVARDIVHTGEVHLP